MLSTSDEIFVFDVFCCCRIFPFLFRWLYFLCVTVWCVMIVVFCHIRLYILDLGISFQWIWFLFNFHEQMTAFWKKKKNSEHPKMYKSLLIKLLDGLSSGRTCLFWHADFLLKFKREKNPKKTSKLCQVNSYLWIVLRLTMTTISVL